MSNHWRQKWRREPRLFPAWITVPAVLAGAMALVGIVGWLLMMSGR